MKNTLGGQFYFSQARRGGPNEVRRGCDVDQPRNLAKSVTVE